MKAILQQLVDKMSVAEKEELLADLKAAIAEDLAAGAAGDPEACPRCGCPRFTRKGRDADGSQRWLCAGCGRTFSAKTMGLLAQSKLPAETWMAFAECMADCLSLRESAARCSVSLYTSWFMRMRVCEVMRSRLLPARAGTFHVDELLVTENISGKHPSEGPRSMPRKAHRNGRDGRKRGCGRMQKIVVSCGVNELGDCFCDAVARGGAGMGDLGLNLLGRVPRGSTVVTDGYPAYGIVASCYDHVAAGTYDINMANALHSRIRDFLRPFHGVSTRRLQKYLDWFRYREQFKASDVGRRELLFAHEASGTYESTRSWLHVEIGEFMAYWIRQKSMVV